jgi:hypothetical protein
MIAKLGDQPQNGRKPVAAVSGSAGDRRTKESGSAMMPRTLVVGRAAQMMNLGNVQPTDRITTID